MKTSKINAINEVYPRTLDQGAKDSALVTKDNILALWESRNVESNVSALVKASQNSGAAVLAVRDMTATDATYFADVPSMMAAGSVPVFLGLDPRNALEAAHQKREARAMADA